jgi:hypothetical protein
VLCFLGDIDCIEAGRASSVLHATAKRPASWNPDFAFFRLLYGMRGAKCDWNKAERMLQAREPSARTDALWGLLAMERAGWKGKEEPELHREAVRLWARGAEQSGDLFACVWLALARWRQEASESSSRFQECRPELASQAKSSGAALLWLARMDERESRSKDGKEADADAKAAAAALGLLLARHGCRCVPRCLVPVPA